METLKTKGVHIVSNKENIDSSTPTGKLMLTMIGAIAEFERQNMLERQAEGIAIAKRKGKFKGGQVKKIDEKRWNQYYNQYMQRGLTKAAFAKTLNISRPTLDKLIGKERSGKLLK